ncbi:nicotinate phosphoribosyltransferase [Spirochaeta dissipatitropha]
MISSQPENPVSGLFTDFYELTMMQGYLQQDHNPEVVFEYFFRRAPFDSGYAVFAGLEPLLRSIERLSFSNDDIQYLNSLKMFSDDFLSYLSNYRFSGSIYAAREGSIVFPREPIIRVHAKLAEAQLLEGLILNTINFQTLIATKAARITHASRNGSILEFGLRRAQGPDGALSASRAAFIGGARATSNTLAGKLYGIPVRGTMAHSWVMAFPDELSAFKAYADLYPDSSIFLIDTYDTLGSGLQAAMSVGATLSRKGKSWGVRLDSGDLSYLSQEVRKTLDQHGHNSAKIVVSNELNEEIIQQLVSDEAPIDAWGVGTRMVSGEGDPGLTGVYKLCAKLLPGQSSFTSVMKLSNNPEKTTDPGIKQVYRFFDRQGIMLADMISLDSEKAPENQKLRLYHPLISTGHYDLPEFSTCKALLEPWMEDGRISRDLPQITEIQSYTRTSLAELHPSHQRLLNPHRYKISFSAELRDLKTQMQKDL